jgi:uncharacterized RDD family membrane protein YckC
MPCLLCGDICRCSSNADPVVSPRWLADDDACVSAEMSQYSPQTPASDQPTPPDEEAAGSVDGSECLPEDAPAWRQEVAARLNRYQSKRKPRPPRYPSLRLQFEENDSTRNSVDVRDESTFFLPTASNHALALDGFVDRPAPIVETARSASLAPPENHFQRTAQAFVSDVPIPAPATAKIIEFPCSWMPPPAPLDELAEPVVDRPRILEAPEAIPPPPALGGITIEPAHQPELEKRPGIDVPLQSASLSRRIFSTAIDGVIVATACALFAYIFWKITAIQPPRFQILGSAAGLIALFWFAYQYLLVVYSGSTPGLRLAKLELARFNGTPASRSVRRWRVLASFLSAVSLGMGYAWVFLDEDALCWHDRITHTYLAPKSPEQH